MFRGVFIVFLLTILPTLRSSESSQPGEAADRAAIKAVLDAHGVAWTRGDADAAAATLTEDYWV